MAESSIKISSQINLLLVVFFFITGCSSTEKNDKEIRVENIKVFRDGQAEKEKQYLYDDQSITIDKAVEIALENNYELELNKLHLRLAELGKDSAFGSFLPKVTLSASAQGTDVSQGIYTGSNFIEMSDQHTRHTSLSIQQSLFNPQAWYIYQMKKTGVDIQKNINERFKQLITLQVKSHYISYFIIEERKKSIQRKIDEFETMEHEMDSQVKEGLILKSVLLQLKARITELQFIHDSLCGDQIITKGSLLKAMGLAPDSTIELITPSLKHHNFTELKELIAQALLCRTELFITDKNIELSEEELSRSIAAFLPNIGISGGPSYSTDSLLQHATVWNYGLNGVMTLFNGMQNISSYKAAKVQGKQAELKRDMEVLSIILDVINAYKIHKDYLALLNIAQQDLEVAQCKYNESVALKREGLLEPSAFLHNVTNKYSAKSNETILKYQAALSAMTLQDIIGNNNNEDTHE